MFDRRMVGHSRRETNMKIEKMIIVRIYMMEADKKVKTVLQFLEEKANVKGYTIFNAAKGEGERHKESSFWWDDLSTNTPIVIEFFGSAEVINSALEFLSTEIKPAHLIFWEVNRSQN